MIFDVVRKKLIPLTPEEYVRQHVIHYFHHQYKTPMQLMSVERELKYNSLKKRFDLVVFNRNAEPVVIVECKSPDVKINKETLIQICTYNQIIMCRWLWVTNGIDHYWFENVEGKISMTDFPETI